MADLIMTMSSDDEQPVAVKTAPSASNVKAERKDKRRKATKKAKKDAKRGKKRSMDDVSDQDDSELELANGRGGVGADEPDDAQMAKNFVFDGLGGGYVGSRRNNVWVSLVRFKSGLPAKVAKWPCIVRTLGKSTSSESRTQWCARIARIA